MTGIRFYKAAANTGTHIGSLWSAGGTLLASATFTNETASGWQQVYFSTPVQVAPNTTYVAGYFAPNGHYSMASGAFSSGGVENGPLLALANGTSGNGVRLWHGEHVPVGQLQREQLLHRCPVRTGAAAHGAAVGAHGCVGEPRDEPGAGELDGAEQRRRECDHRTYGHAVRGRGATDPD